MMKCQFVNSIAGPKLILSSGSVSTESDMSIGVELSCSLTDVDVHVGWSKGGKCGVGLIRISVYVALFHIFVGVSLSVVGVGLSVVGVGLSSLLIGSRVGLFPPNTNGNERHQLAKHTAEYHILRVVKIILSEPSINHHMQLFNLYIYSKCCKKYSMSDVKRQNEMDIFFIIASLNMY